VTLRRAAVQTAAAVKLARVDRDTQRCSTWLRESDRGIRSIPRPTDGTKETVAQTRRDKSSRENAKVT
jgi:hypothetical protein